MKYPKIRRWEVIMSGSENKISPQELFELYYASVYNYVFYRLLHREDAEDVVSQVFVKAVAAFSSFDPEKASAKTWLYRIAQNTITDFYRRKRKVISIDDEAAGLDNVLSVDFETQYDNILSPERRALYKALTQLNDRDRTFIYFKYFEDMTNRDIAKLMDMNESTVGAVLLRARGKLKGIIEEII